MRGGVPGVVGWVAKVLLQGLGERGGGTLQSVASTLRHDSPSPHHTSSSRMTREAGVAWLRMADASLRGD